MTEKLRINGVRRMLVLCVIALWIASYFVIAQQPKQENEVRDLGLSAWNKSRPQSQTLSPSGRGKPDSAPSPLIYVVKQRMPKGRNSAPDAEVGVSIWRLRRSNASDEVKDIIHPKTGGPKEEWTPELVEAEPAIPLGSYIRLSIESLRKGYLYVINRTKYADGTFGELSLIFPTPRINNGGNAVKPGQVIQIPGPKDDPPYYELIRGESKNQAKQEGEEIIVLVAKAPQLDGDVIASLVRKYEHTSFELSEMKDGAGRTITKTESIAARNSAILLTSNDPYPQSIYRVAAKADDPLLVIVRLRVSDKKPD